MDNKPLVSISCVTYNQAPYIRECLDGFLMQITNFSFEVIVHDDASTDGTREIIEEYALKHPKIIFPFFQVENQYSKGVRGMRARYTYKHCKGKYIAACDGDDYWIDPLKLQKQVDVFEKIPDTIICGTRSKTWNEESQEFTDITPPLDISETSFTVQEFLKRKIWVKACTRLIKSEDLLSVPLDYQIDFVTINYLIAKNQKKKIVFLPDITTVYREHKGGVYTSKTQIQKNITDFEAILLIAKLYEGKKRNQYIKKARIKAQFLYREKSLSLIQRLYYFVEYFRLNPKLTIHEFIIQYQFVRKI